MYTLRTFVPILFALLLLLASCGKEDDPEPVGQAPVANAGSDLQASVNSAVSLNGSASSDPDGGALTYAWSLTTRPDGSNASITGPTQATASFTPDVEGTYVATLTVTDTDNNTASDAVTIIAAEAVGQPPVASIVAENGRPVSKDNNNNTIAAGAPFALDGSGSSDPDTNPDDLTFAWEITDKPDGSSATVTAEANNSDEATFVPDVLGDYVVRLTVSDPEGNSATAEATITANATPVLISNNITEDRTLEDLFSDPTLPDYRVTTSINATAVLTVEPGVVVEFAENAFLTVESGGGALIALGEASNKITFTTANLAGGIRWGGIYFASQDSRNAFDHVGISYGGGANMTRFADFVDVPANIGLGEGAKLKLTNTEVSHSGGYGMYVRYGEIPEFSSNTFTDNTRSGLGLTIAQAAVVDPATTFADNTAGDVEIFGSTVNENITLETLSGDAYYFVSGSLTLAADIMLNAGVELRMNEDVFITVTDDGSLIAEGTEANRVVLTAQDSDNPWGGIKMASTDSKNKLDYTTVSLAGGIAIREFADFIDVPTNIGLYGGARLSLTNSTVSDGEGYGIYVRYGELAAFENNTISGNAEYGIGLHTARVDELDANTTFADNTKGAVEIFGGTMDDEASTWVALKDNARYVVTGGVTIQQVLTIKPGAKFDFDNDIFFQITKSGSLIAVGKSDSTIVFTSAAPGTFRWRGLFINSSTSNNKLDYTEVSFGGSSKYDFANFVDANVNVGIGSSALVNITNSTITNSGSYGIYSDGSVNSNLEEGAAGNTFTNNPDGNRY